jgi:hypothetical protein
MNERWVDGERTVIADHQAAEIARARRCCARRSSASCSVAVRAHPGALFGNGSSDAGQSGPRHAVAAGRAARRCRSLCGDYPRGLLSRTPRTMSSSYPDRLERLLRKPDLRRGSSVKSDSQRNTAAVDHHHPLRPLAPLGLSDCGAPFPTPAAWTLKALAQVWHAARFQGPVEFTISSSDCLPAHSEFASPPALSPLPGSCL